MSAYIQFFLRVGDKFAPIYNSSCSSEVYQCFERYAPWEKIAPLDNEQLIYVRQDAKASIDHYEKSIKEAEDEIEFLKGALMQTEERMEQFHDLKEYINDLRDSIKEKEYVLDFCSFIQSMIDEAHDEKKWGSNPLNLDPEAYVYVGIEVGTPTIEDIEK